MVSEEISNFQKKTMGKKSHRLRSLYKGALDPLMGSFFGVFVIVGADSQKKKKKKNFMLRISCRVMVQAAVGNQRHPFYHEEEITDYVNSCENVTRVAEGSMMVPQFLNAIVRPAFGVKLHYPIFFGLRQNGLRGVFLDQKASVPRGAPVVTVPLRSSIHVDNVRNCKHACHDLLPQHIEPYLHSEELRPLLPQMYLGIQFAYMMARLPTHREKPTADTSVVTTTTSADEEPDDVMAWCRMIDDEDWSEDFIARLYGSALDEWQKKSYGDMCSTTMRSLSSIHKHLRDRPPLDLVQRIVRVVLARTDHFPDESELAASPLRRVRRILRNIRGIKPTKRVGLIPMVDMLNHSNLPNVTVQFGYSEDVHAPAAIVRSVVPIQGGQEVCRHYNFACERPSALFRYGFLPFDTINVVEMDNWKEHVWKSVLPNQGPADAEKIKLEKKLDDEVEKLQNIYRKAKANIDPKA